MRLSGNVWSRRFEILGCDMSTLGRYFIPLITTLLVAGCAGFRGGWESVAYLAHQPPPNSQSDSGNQGRLMTPPELSVPGLKLQVSMDNLLRTYDTQVYFFILPLSVDPRNVFVKNVEAGKTRVFVTVTPQVGGFVFRPSATALQVAGKRFSGAAGFEFGMWDAGGNRVLQGGKWEHRPITSDFMLAEIGRRYHLSIDFMIPAPSPESHDIVLDLSEALRSADEPSLPLIRFAPVRWKEGYT